MIRPYCEIDLNNVHEDDIQDRDKAIFELYDELQRYVGLVCEWDSDCEFFVTQHNSPLQKYEKFVSLSRKLYGV